MLQEIANAGLDCIGIHWDSPVLYTAAGTQRRSNYAHPNVTLLTHVSRGHVCGYRPGGTRWHTRTRLTVDHFPMLWKRERWQGAALRPQWEVPTMAILTSRDSALTCGSYTNTYYYVVSYSQYGNTSRIIGPCESRSNRNCGWLRATTCSSPLIDSNPISLNVSLSFPSISSSGSFSEKVKINGIFRDEEKTLEMRNFVNRLGFDRTKSLSEKN